MRSSLLLKRCCRMLLVLLAGIHCTPVQASAADSQRTELVKQIVDLAYGVPPEFGADALLQLLESGAVAAPQKKLDLLEEAVRMAGESRFQHKLQYYSGPTDTREGWLAQAYDLNLDAESLKCRSVRLMVPLRPLAARLLLQTMMPAVKHHDCRSTLIRDPRIFYRTLSYVATAAFTAQERAANAHIDYLIPFFDSASSPVQIVPLAEVLLETAGSSRDQLANLLSHFASALRRTVQDDRGFRNGYGLMEAADKIADRALTAQVPSDEFVRSMRTYIVRNLTGLRCADSVLPIVKIPKRPNQPQGISEKFTSWNARFPPYASSEVRPLTAAEQGATALGAAADNPGFWTSPKAKDLLSSVQQLRFGPKSEAGSRPQSLSVETRKGPEWNAELTAFLTKMDAWKPSDEPTELDHFFQKCSLYTALIELVPEGAQRDRLLAEYLAFLTSSRLQYDDPVNWFLQAWELVSGANRSRVTEAAAGNSVKQEVNWILQHMEGSGSAILRLRALLAGLGERSGSPR